MSLLSVSVITNALRLRKVRLCRDEPLCRFVTDGMKSDWVD